MTSSKCSYCSIYGDQQYKELALAKSNIQMLSQVAAKHPSPVFLISLISFKSELSQKYGTVSQFVIPANCDPELK